MNYKHYNQFRLISTLIAFLLSISSIIICFVNNNIFDTLIILLSSSMIWVIRDLIEVYYASKIRLYDKNYDAKEDIVLSHAILFCMTSLLFTMVLFIKHIIDNGFKLEILTLAIPIGLLGFVLSNLYNIRGWDINGKN